MFYVAASAPEPGNMWTTSTALVQYVYGSLTPKPSGQGVAWIVERPVSDLSTGSRRPLANYGTMQIYNATAFNTNDAAKSAITWFGSPKNDDIFRVMCVNNTAATKPRPLSTVNWGNQFTWQDFG